MSKFDIQPIPLRSSFDSLSYEDQITWSELRTEQEGILHSYGYGCGEVTFEDARDLMRHKAFLSEADACFDLACFQFLQSRMIALFRRE